jgi:hypothetical protein
MPKRVEIDGLKDIQKSFKAFRKEFGKKVRKGISKAGLRLKKESRHLVPIETRELYNSAFSRTSGSGLNAVAQVGYNMPYAVRVHEDLTLAHGEVFNQKYARQRLAAVTAAEKIKYALRRPQEQAKFLEQPAREKTRELFDEVKKAVS